jgi:hypothetical protein
MWIIWESCSCMIELYVYIAVQYAGPSDRAVWGVGLRPLACWDWGFESHRGHGCLLWVLCVEISLYSIQFFFLKMWKSCSWFMAVLLIPCVLNALHIWTSLNVWDYAPLILGFHVHELFGLAPAIILVFFFLRIISPAWCETIFPSKVIPRSILEWKKDDLILFDCVSVVNIRHRSNCVTSFTSIRNHLIRMIVPV